MKPNKAVLGLNVQVTDVDHGYRRIAAELAGLSEIEVGVFGPDAAREHGTSGLTVGNIAFMHETGSGGMKMRSFVRKWMDENEPRLREQAAAAIQRIVTDSSTRKKESEKLGAEWAEEVRKFIDGGHVSPANAPATIEWKGHATPMIGLTRAVRNAVKSRVYLPSTKKMKAIVSSAVKKAAGGLVRVNYDFEQR